MYRHIAIIPSYIYVDSIFDQFESHFFVVECACILHTCKQNVSLNLQPCDNAETKQLDEISKVISFPHTQMPMDCTSYNAEFNSTNSQYYVLQ